MRVCPGFCPKVTMSLSAFLQRLEGETGRDKVLRL